MNHPFMVTQLSASEERLGTYFTRILFHSTMTLHVSLQTLLRLQHLIAHLAMMLIVRVSLQMAVNISASANKLAAVLASDLDLILLVGGLFVCLQGALLRKAARAEVAKEWSVTAVNN